MKKVAILLIIVALVFSSGCSVLKTNNLEAQENSLKALGLAYSNGEYSLENVDCYAWITNGFVDLHVAIPMGKLLLDNQEIKVKTINEVALRSVDGSYIGGFKADLTEYVYSVYKNNDGAIMHVVLRNDEKWNSIDGEQITNNTPITGYISVAFTIS